MGGGCVQRGAKEGGQEEDVSRRWGSGQNRGKGCGYSIIGGTSAAAASPMKEDEHEKTEQRPRHNEERADVGMEDGHVSSYAANIRGDSNAQLRIKDILR
jgi:hypothetical protein